MTIYFYKADQSYGCFSNFSPHPIQCFGKVWPTVEHFYQAHKFVNTPHQNLLEIIRQVPTPEEAAAIGRNSQYSLRSDWEDAKRNIMWQGITTKFMTYPDLREILLSTGEETIIEDSPRDYYWGCGKDRTGQNHLGRMLMTLRATLRLHQVKSKK